MVDAISGISGIFLILLITFGPLCATVVASSMLWRRQGKMHLSTAVILLILTGTLVGLNLSKHRGVYVGGGGIETASETYYGFPGRAIRIVEAPPPRNPDIDDSLEKLPDGRYLVHDDIIPIPVAISWNFSFGLAILLWSWVLCEKRIQRIQAVKEKFTEPSPAQTPH